MKPLRQTTFAGPGGAGDLGNCWSTCIAMVIDEQVEAVPNFVAIHGPPKMVWWTEARRWLRDGGVDIAQFAELPPDEKWPDPPRYVIALGPSPRGDFDHAVVWDRQALSGTRQYFDPHPSDDLLAGPAYGYDVIVTPYDPDPDTEAAEMAQRDSAS